MSDFLQDQGNQRIARRLTRVSRTRDSADYAEIAEKGHLWMETNQFPKRNVGMDSCVFKNTFYIGGYK